MKLRFIGFLVGILGMLPIAVAQESQDYAIDTIVYKTVDGVSLEFIQINPLNKLDSMRYPALVFFFGGGWVEGNVKQFEPQARYFAQRGMICFLVDYRVESRHGTSPFDALMDAKSAIRYIRGHANSLVVDPDQIIASGGSAGGQLAAACAVINGYNDPQDDQTIDCKPNALILYNPVIDNGPGNRTNQKVGDLYKDFSPLHNIEPGAPPTLIFQGTEDNYTPTETIQYYQLVMEYVGSRCDLILYEGQKHGFFNLTRSEVYYNKTLMEADKFLISLGYLNGNPAIND